MIKSLKVVSFQETLKEVELFDPEEKNLWVKVSCFQKSQGLCYPGQCKLFSRKGGARQKPSLTGMSHPMPLWPSESDNVKNSKVFSCPLIPF